MDITELALCAGVGWLSLGIELAAEFLDWPYRCVGHCERDSYAAAVILARMEDETMGRAAVFAGCLEDLDSRSLRGHASLISAGFPCQPWSHAGKQAGTQDERWLWPAIADVVRHVEPEYLFLENVPGLVSGHGIEYVLSDLAEMRFDAEWLSIPAAGVGASHKRERLFILAYSRHAPRHAKHLDKSRKGLRRGAGTTDAMRLGAGSKPMGHTEHSATGNGGSHEEREPVANSGRGLQRPTDGSGVLGDSQGIIGRCGFSGLSGASGGREFEIAGESVEHSDRDGRHEATASETGRGPDANERCAGLFAPGPGLGGNGVLDDIRELFRSDPRAAWSRFEAERRNTQRWRNVLETRPWLAPAIEPGFRLLANGSPLVLDASRADQLRCAGNGVVPLQAACAFIELARRAGLISPAK